jgi:threonine dehydrogenase-like Zn-dependent dehydrogenase
VAVTAAGICGSELTSFTGDSTRRAPGRVFGHEFVGRVARTGSEVASDIVGELVAVNPLSSCGLCRQCRGGRPNACPDRSLLGLHVDGAFAEEVAVPHGDVRRLAGLDELAGALAEPLANAVHAVGLLGNVVGRRIAVFGAGTIGLCVTQVLRIAGAASIIAVDPVESRRERALAAGADEAITAQDAEAELVDFVDAVDAAGLEASRRTAIDAAPPGATVVLLGMHQAESKLPINLAISKELALVCSYAYTAQEFDTALGLLHAGAVARDDWITEFTLADGQQAFETLIRHPEAATKIILRP